MISSLVAGCALLSPVSAQAAPTSGATTAGEVTDKSYTPPPIEWAACTNGLQHLGGECGFLVVPLDYSRPHGTKIKIAVSRIKHTSSEADYQGAMVVNLTWPGGSALSQSTVGKLLPEAISGDYDWIGFDPRGVGASEPTLSCDSGLDYYSRPSYEPTSRQHLSTLMEYAQFYSKACAKTNSPLLRHATTTHTVKDLDSLRKALGLSQINYYGYLYGAYLGEVYSSMYPTRVRRMILDSSIDPRKVWFSFNNGQDAPLDQNFSAFSAWVAKYDNLYHLGTTENAVKKQYYSTLAKLAKKPAEGVYGAAVWTDVALLAYNTSHWKTLAEAFSAYINKGETAPLKALYDANYPTSGDNNQAMSMATMCTDTRWPRDWRTWLRVAEDHHRKWPLAAWANTWYVASCQSWKVPPQKPAVVDGSKAPAILMVLDTTIDPASTYEGSLAVRKLFPKAVLVQSGATPADSATPTSCSPGAAIAAYLNDGTLPPRVAGNTADLKCPANPLPDPTSAASAQNSPLGGLTVTSPAGQ
ncbi:pimeloyl-ACP methyl ester carboxylesterase [Thermocatellispora tengchongensis]|uniref:Pimeloyl-ACP methyl ester carboxylesterase n=1 Tax=Thermocatellispora tengchongensis TaxID=1073253 RepID=A0A840PI50_9ACTN|nr:alpha/beta fold hydrolase [Thermocatellispora tengchongensis]MBB5137481.1 pimeloyl-ACP methyl ester carboxylesterase [Thermocatellispora tengchongensis]